MKLKYQRFKLANGIRVFMVPKKETKAVHIEVMFKVGSRYETEDIRGISHFLEHMMSKGTKRRPTAMDINKEIDRVGGSSNAYTGLDVTGYWIRLPAEKIELGMDLMSDMLLSSKFEEKEIGKEKGVILEEIKMIYDSPYSFANRKAHELVFGDGPLGRDVLGTEETVKKVNRAKIKRYHSKYYKTNNMVVAVGGSINQAKTKKLLKKYFGKMKGSVKDEFVKSAPQQTAPIVRVYHRDIKQAGVIMGFRSFGRNGSDQDRTIRSVLSKILGGYTSSILWEKLREDKGLAYDIGAGTDVYDETGAFFIYGGFDPSKLPMALKEIFKVIREAKKSGFSTHDIKMAKENKLGKLALSLEGAAGWASDIAAQALFEKHIELPDETIKKIKKVKNDDLKRLAQEIFRPENLNIFILGPLDPKKDEKKFLDLVKL